MADMKKLRLYDTASRKVSEFKPIVAGQASIYLCGATVQASPHVGHVRSGINFDILRRWLIASGYNVTFIRNVTDIDDKIIHNAGHEDMPWWALAMKYERSFSDAYRALNVMAPTYEPRATGHITQMIELIEKLITNGSAYAPGNGDVYLEVRKLKSYLTLSNQKLDDLLVAKDGEEKLKRDPRDFALWKGAKEGEPYWPTPWGNGRPGWHIECSAMAHAYLGQVFDIHGGGLDLIFPHHENEIAQSEAAGYEFARLWMHNAWVTTSGEKMSKSLGNSLKVDEVLKKVRGIELRWYLSSAHYRSMLEFSFEALDEAVVSFKRIENFLNRAKELLGSAPGMEISQELSDALNDDLAVPQVLAQISEWLKLGNSALSASDKAQVAKYASYIRAALSIIGTDPFDSAYSSSSSADLTGAVDGLISLLLEQRSAARARKDFAAADQIRDQIIAMGISIEDRADGVRWSING
ncbi:MAG TPA: cysteine--tRNA ligase [Candidatus Nanopelagicaceae bacterium]|nr:cysteine--tRNA ligase [Candidatus Nanopelagicaceae bacterium]